ncbi:MAG: hypothetical protein JXA11_08795 [Phycisphaerae bacterium]|nr:hypothetical protein [Phycisphaerae bacterium]
MKIELHLHTNRYSGCAKNSPEEMLDRLVELHYQAVFLTEHDAVWPGDELENLQRHWPQLRIFPGLELTLHNFRGFGHLLILGATEPEFLDIVDPGEALARARQKDYPTILAHPYRWEGAADMLEKGYYPDAIECSTPNVFPEQAILAQVKAGEFRMPVVNSGDAHGVDFLGRYWIETAESIESPAQMRQILLEGSYDNCSAE